MWITIGISLSLLILFPLILVLALPVACSYTVMKDLRHMFKGSFKYCCCLISLMILAFILGIIVDPIVIPLIIVIGIPYLIVKGIRDKIKTHRRSNRRLKAILEEN